MKGGHLTKNALVFGLGTNPDEPFRYDYMFRIKSDKENCEWRWTGCGEVLLDEFPNFIQLDFNDNSLLGEKLEDDHYDLIMFDWSTTKFLRWNNEILNTIKKKLKVGGKLLIPNPINEYITFSSLTRPEMFSIFDIENNIIQNQAMKYYNPSDDILPIGMNFNRKKPYFIDSTSGIIRYYKWNEYMKNVSYEKSLVLLRTIFGSANVSYDIGDYPVALPEFIDIDVANKTECQAQIDRYVKDTDEDRSRMYINEFTFDPVNNPIDKMKASDIVGPCIRELESWTTRMNMRFYNNVIGNYYQMAIMRRSIPYFSITKRVD